MNMEIMTTIKSKADALVFAINIVCENGATFDKEKVDEIYDYILSKVELPDVERDVCENYLDTMNGMLSRCTEAIMGYRANENA